MSTFLLEAESDTAYCGAEAIRFLNSIKQFFLQLDNQHFTTLIGSNQKAQKVVVDGFQNAVMDGLAKLDFGDTTWKKEAPISSASKDKADLLAAVFLDGITYKVIIEFDKPRADQVAKKFLSRTASTLAEPTIYLAVCYTGTAKMNRKELRKYVSYCCAVSDKLSTPTAPRVFAGLLLQDIHLPAQA